MFYEKLSDSEQEGNRVKNETRSEGLKRVLKYLNENEIAPESYGEVILADIATSLAVIADVLIAQRRDQEDSE